MIRTIAWLALAAIVLLLAYAATRPDTFRVERSTTIRAPSERLFPLINDLHQFNRWNPYNRKDPAMKTEYSGPDAGPGARYGWQGNKNVGRGSMTITGVDEPASVTLQLDILEPFEGHNTVVFSLVPQGDGATRVTWAMHGPSNFISKLMGIFFNMDQMIGRDFEAGLVNLKTLAEKA
jgi:uncharacterized protein YndB with AHSA1/START domain